MGTNIVRLLREGLLAHFSVLQRLLIIILGKLPSCSSCSYAVRLTAGSLSVPLALVQNGYTCCLGKLNFGISLLLVLEWACSVLPLSRTYNQKLGLYQDTSQAFRWELQPDPERVLTWRAVLASDLHLSVCVSRPLWSRSLINSEVIRLTAGPSPTEVLETCQGLRLMSGASASFKNQAWKLTGHLSLNTPRICTRSSAR